MNRDVPWPGQVPPDWRIAPIRRVATIVNGGTPSPLPEYWGGDVRWATPVDLSAVDGAELGGTVRTLTPEGLRVGSSAVPAGSVLLSTRAPIGYSALTRYVTAFNQGCKALVPSDDLQPRFLLYVMQACKAELSSRGQGTTFLELPAGALGSTQVPVPPVDEQRAIVDFLDRETVEIDAFIADQEELIRLLAERRTASLLTETLGCRAELAGPLGRFLRKEYRGVKELDVVTAFRDGQVTARVNRREDGFTMSEDGAGYQGVRVGDLVFHGLDGFAGAVGIADSGGRCSPVYHVCSTVQGINIQFMAFYLRALGISGFLEAYAWSVRQRSVDYRNWTTFSRLPLRLPSLAEQTASVIRLREETVELEAAIADAREAIALSTERRAALISAAVTGKIDVRGAA